MRSRKNRTSVPTAVSDEVQFRSDRICCVCRHPGKAYQLHHLNEDPTDHSPDNLAVLCLDCHNLTQVRGGFSRHLSPGQVRLYREQWYDLVERRRATGEEGAASTPAPATGDQELLDDLLHLLSRDSIRTVGNQNFVESWPDTLTNPVQVLINEYREVENEFSDPELEAARVELLDAAFRFAYEEAMHGFVSNYNPRRRISGYTSAEAEGVPDRERAIQTHSSAILPVARRFVEAHTSMIRVARRRGYRVDALARDRHPRVREIDAISEDRDPA